MQDITLPEVSAARQSARFFKEDGVDRVEIKFVGQKDTIVSKVTPEIMAKYRKEWNSYRDGLPLERRQGTPLTDVQNLNDQVAEQLIAQNVHTAEELVFLSDADCQALGHGTLTYREAAKKLIALRRLQGEENARNAMTKAVSGMKSAPEAPPAEIAEIKQGIQETNDLLRQLVQALTPKPEHPAVTAAAEAVAEVITPRKPGRPPKVKAQE